MIRDAAADTHHLLMKTILSDVADDYRTETLWHYPSEAPATRLDRWLAEVAPEFSRSQWQRWIREGCVAVDGEVVTRPNTLLLPGATVVAAVEPPAHERVTPEPRILPVVFEDEHLLVLDKPAGWVVHPGAGNWNGTLMHYLLAYDPRLTEVPRAGIVHRLDKETSGLMVVAKSAIAHQALVAALAARTVRRRYWAVVAGRIDRPQRIDAPIGRHPTQRVKMAVVAHGKPAVTHVTPLEQFGNAATLVQCELESGRTHQIRVHLAHVGHPLISDPLYGDRRSTHPLLARQALHAVALAFHHPVHGEPLAFASPLPAELEQLLVALRPNTV